MFRSCAMPRLPVTRSRVRCGHPDCGSPLPARLLLLLVPVIAAGVSFGEPQQQALPPPQVQQAEAEDAALLMDLADVYQRHRRYEKALELFSQALEKVERDYDRSRIHMSIARIKLRLNRKDEAAEHMEQALALAPAEGPKTAVYPELIGLLMREGTWDRARALARDYVDEAGTEIEKRRASHYLIQTYEGEGRLGELAQQIEQELGQRPEDAELLSQLALTYERMPNASEKAAEVYERLCQVRPEDTTAFFRLARIYEKMGQLDRAARVYLRLIESVGDAQQFNADYVRVRVAKLYADAGNQEQALIWLRMIEESAAADPGVVSLKADLYARLGMLQEALQCYDGALQNAQKPDDRARFLFQSADLLRNSRDYEGAEKRLKAIIEDPDMSERARKAAQTTLSTLREHPD